MNIVNHLASVHSNSWIVDPLCINEIYIQRLPQQANILCTYLQIISFFLFPHQPERVRHFRQQSQRPGRRFLV